MLYVLNLYSDVCQLFLSKTGKINKYWGINIEKGKNIIFPFLNYTIKTKINSQWPLWRLDKVKIPTHGAGKCVMRKSLPKTHGEILNCKKLFGKQFHNIN